MSKLITMGNVPAKTLSQLQAIFTKQTKCAAEGCNEFQSTVGGTAKEYCLVHREEHHTHSGAGRNDRPWTYHKEKYCEVCGWDPYADASVACAPSALLHGHHIKPKEVKGGNEKKNLVTVCDSCHKNIHHFIDELIASTGNKVLLVRQYHEAVERAREFKKEAEIIRLHE